MRFSHKISKLAQPLTYQRAWRRAQRYLHPVPVGPLLAKLDQSRLRSLRAQYAASGDHYAKYVDVERWLRLNIVRAQDRKLHRSPPLSVLDLGCGGGFFLYVAKDLGHTVLGLDIDEFPLFGQLLDLFGVNRTVWTIHPFEPLPNLGRRFDLVTGFSVEFNRLAANVRWGRSEWGFFLDDLQEHHLTPRGRLFFGLNPGPDGEYYTPKLRQFFLDRGAHVERENVTFPPRNSWPG